MGEILKRNLFLLLVLKRSGSLVLWNANLVSIIRKLTLHLGCLMELVQLAFFGQWNQLNTMPKTTLLWHVSGKGFNVIMTTSLSSDVPVGYFSWAEYDIMAPIQPKTEQAVAAAFISNCAARNFRLQSLEGLEKSDIKIDSYGGCHRNRNGNVNKVEALKRYKFSLAFENSNEEDYVTEKFFQSLVAVDIALLNYDELLKECCLNLESLLTQDEDVDSDGNDMIMELHILSKMLSNVAYEEERSWTSIQIMEFAKKMDMFPNILLAYKILLTIQVTVAYVERSFSKLKLLKSYLHSTMSQERLNGLAILSYQSSFLANVDYDKIIEVFASKNVRRLHFR